MPMLNMPQRQTLTRQTVDALREGMATGIWKDFLPGERELCSLLQVSSRRFGPRFRLSSGRALSM